MFGFFPAIFFIMFAIIIGMFIFTIVRSVSQWHRNNKSPVLSVEATVVAKRAAVGTSHHSSGDTGAMHVSHNTTYYATFQFESGDRLELVLSGQDYGMLAERDFGKLTFQGTRFLSFVRSK